MAAVLSIGCPKFFVWIFIRSPPVVGGEEEKRFFVSVADAGPRRPRRGFFCSFLGDADEGPPLLLLRCFFSFFSVLGFFSFLSSFFTYSTLLALLSSSLSFLRRFIVTLAVVATLVAN